MRAGIYALFLVLIIFGCSKQPVASNRAFDLTFPVYVTHADADANQQMFENGVVKRILKQSTYPQCAKNKARCIEILPVAAKRRYGMDAIMVHYFHENKLVTQADYPLSVQKTQNGRTYFVTLGAAQNIKSEERESLEDAMRLNRLFALSTKP